MVLSSLMKAKRRKKARNFNTPRDYFSKEVDVHIIRFIKSRSDTKRNKIFEENIKKAFTTLANNLIFVYKVSNLDNVSSLRDDCVRFLYTKIDTYDPKKASKAFSYFNVVARNWFFQRYNNEKKEEKKFFTIDNTNINNSLMLQAKENFESSNYDFFDKRFIEYLNENMNIFKDNYKDNEQKVIECVLVLLNNPDLIDVFNKKAIFIYLRNMTGLNAKQIATAIGKLRTLYYKLKTEWIVQEEKD